MSLNFWPLQADEMLYRAVLLTLVSYWIRDRIYEGGAEDLLSLPGGLQVRHAYKASSPGTLCILFFLRDPTQTYILAS